ncbi:MAM and LDL-receptor class A domain-containing protein 1-like [Diadema setosum]|uniref:MAM and LDL-receptor class A domain-containing protein 1-like n=1 Tax=Diadema setosum TaxID=31175 RepID=UPI003B3B98FD
MCDFETDACSWAEDSADDINFRRLQGPSDDNYRTGPYRDHTTQYIGYYMVMDASTSGFEEGDRARLISPVHQASGSDCRFRTWYHMFGVDMGTLNIFARTSIGGYMNILWTKTGHSNDYWELVDVGIPSSITSNFQIVIEAIRGDGPYGDIGIDDTSFTPDCVKTSGGLPQGATTPVSSTIGPCGAGKWQCDNNECIDSGKYCDYEADCTDGSDEAFCGTCSFEQGLCGYIDMSFGAFAWGRGQETSALAAGIQAAGGYYMTITTGNGQFDEMATLSTSNLPDSAVSCEMTFWYKCSMTDLSNEFRVELLTSDGQSSQLWSRPSWSVTSWTQVTVGIGRIVTSYQILFTAFVTSTSDIVAIDDVIFDQCKVESYSPCEILCDNQICVPYTAACDYADDCGDRTDEQSCDKYDMCNFEQGTVCDWVQDSTADLKWTWVSGNQGSLDGAPGVDHTYNSGTGHYRYLVSGEFDVGKVARLNSIVLSRPANDGDCQLVFWYFMYGVNVRSLTVYTTTSTSGDPIQQWTMSNSQGDLWIKGTVPLNSGRKFMVYFEGVSGGDDDSIALDDIVFSPGCVKDPDQTLPDTLTPTGSPHCGDPNQRACDDGTCIDMERFCNFVYDCNDLSDEADCPAVCDFEDDMCSWTQSTGDQFDWIRYNNTASSDFTGPDSDHTSGSPAGIYYYVDGTSSRQNERATLVSPTFSMAGTNCEISLWYYSYGATYGNLEIRRRVDSQERALLLIDDGNNFITQWKQVVVPISPCLTDFQILIEAGNQQTSQQAGGYAIDDIRFDNCDFAVSTQSCPVGQLQCVVDNCYPQEKRCDMAKDCCMDDALGSDESSCTTYKQCNFEGSMCDWVQVNDADDFDWELVQANKNSKLTYDHTQDDASGYYMVIDRSNEVQSGEKARLGSYIIQASTSDCKMRFYYYKSGADSGYLRVYTRTSVGGPLLQRWTDSTDQGLMWVRGSVDLDSDAVFQVIIEGEKGQSSTSSLAVDDISFTPDCAASPTSLPTITTPGPTTKAEMTTGRRPPGTTRRVTEPTEGWTTQPEGTGQPGTDNTTLIIVLCVVLGTLAIIFVIAALFLWKRRSMRKDYEVKGMAGGMANPGYDADFGNMNFALQEVDTNMFGEYPEEAMPTEEKRAVDNLYATPDTLPINNDTEVR